MSNIENIKIICAVLAAIIIAMLSNFVTDLVYAPEELEQNVYVIAAAEAGESEEAAETAETAETAQPAEPAEAKASPVVALIAAADPGAGEKAVKKCTACHSLTEGGANKIGPRLWNIVGQPIASVEGFSYSKALKAKAGETWSYENLDAFLAKPKTWVPGTKMSFAGLKKPEQRAALIAYLRGLSGNPAPLPQ
ncbi:MAG: cytochrome c family protein [Kiloniellales bacterium]